MKYSKTSEIKWISVNDYLPSEDKEVLVLSTSWVNGATIAQLYKHRGTHFNELLEKYEYDQDLTLCFCYIENGGEYVIPIKDAVYWAELPKFSDLKEF